MAEQAKQQAILDIKEELQRNHKCFLAFRSKLDPVMEYLVSNHIHLQEQLNQH